MNVGFLFDSSDPALGFDYGTGVMDAILADGAVRRSDRHMRVSVGDILIRAKVSELRNLGREEYQSFCRRTFAPCSFERLDQAKLKEAYETSVIYCWLFQNMTETLAEEVHSDLRGTPGYLGAMEISFAEPLQLYFFRQLLSERYRFRGTHVSIFYSGLLSDSQDSSLEERLAAAGFVVSYESIGGRNTIFDTYYTIDHFNRMERFKSVVGAFHRASDDLVSEAVLVLEEIHPRLFDVLAAAARAVLDSQTQEDLAQACLSGRRFLEQLADYWFPPRSGTLDGRSVGQTQYRNRLWAYLTEAAANADPPCPSQSEPLGKRLDDLVKRLNAGLHSSVDRDHVEQVFLDLARWFVDVVRMNPTAAPRPYLAYGQAIGSLLAQSLPDPD